MREYINLKEDFEMITFTILLLMVLILAVVTVVSISVLGSIGIVVFGDLIVCILILVWIMKKIFKKKKK